MNSSIILSRTPFRLSLGGGSTDLPSYYSRHGGFIFSVAINMYMDILIKSTRSDDSIHVHYKTFEAAAKADEVKHDLAREALKMTGINQGVAISFKADTPAGTGLGSSGACSVALLKGLSAYRGQEMTNLEAAEKSFEMTQNLGLPDGKQDPYACAIGGFLALDIDINGEVTITKPQISQTTIDKFFNNTLLLYTGIRRDSRPFLTAQDEKKVWELKHQTKRIGQEIYQSFLNGDLEKFGLLMDEHWQIKKAMSPQMSNVDFDQIYNLAKGAGSLGGKIIGAGGGGYFLFYCPSKEVKESVRQAVQGFNLREMSIQLDAQGARTQKIDL
jgi:D-glycero-alpha-D-manno-heptose-7-phosphate kinase